MRLKSIVFFSLIALQSTSLLAALGSAPGTGLATQTATPVTVNKHVGYSVNEVTLVSGTLVREYVSAGNVVFGVVWQGPTMPDLRQLLGTSAAKVTTGANAPDSGRNLNITTSDFVLHSGGHMRSFQGDAYIPSLVPAGVTPDDIN